MKYGKLFQGLRGILFDMDGVLIDSEPIHQDSLVVLSDRMGRRLAPAEVEALKGMTEMATILRLKQMIPSNAGDPAQLIAERVAIYLNRFDSVQAIPAALEYLAACRGRGHRLGLVTSSMALTQRMACDRFGYSEYFEAVTTGDDVQYGKPDPEPYLRTASLLKLDPKHCLVIEDSVNGVLSGKAAGCRVVGLTTSFPAESLLASGADEVVDSFRELNGMMESNAVSLFPGMTSCSAA